MSRVKDLRDLICVSRLTIRDSDDEAVFSGDEAKSPGSSERNAWTSVQVQKSFSDQCHLTSTPDSGFSANGQPASDSQDSDDESTCNVPPLKTRVDRTARGKDSVDNSGGGNQKKKKTRSRPPQTSVSEGPISKTSPLSRSHSSSQKPSSSLLKNELLSVLHHRVDTRALGDRCGTPSTDFAEGHFEKLLMFVDGAVVSEWLEQSNRNVADLTNWCHTEENFVHFAHFWLSQFPDKEKFEIFRLEYTILLDQLSFAFAAGLNAGEIQQRHLSMFLNAVYREYPAKLMSTQGAHLFLDYLDVLSLSKRLQYRELLSDVRCSTRIQQHIQWILATRSFAVVSVWTAVVNFYKTLNGNADVRPPSVPPPPPLDVDLESGLYLRRMYTAIRHGYADVVHYLLRSGKVAPNSCDRQQKSLVFYAVAENQAKVVRVLLSQSNKDVDGNRPASNGNTPLHAAANRGSVELVEALLASGRTDVNVCNPQCDNATPLHLAILHGHLEIVRLLLSAGADRTMKMGDLSAIDVARDFGQEEILELLEEKA